MVSIDTRLRHLRRSATPRMPGASIDASFFPALRKLRPADQDDVEAHLLRLGAADRQMRFCGSVSDRSIIAYCEQINWSETIVLGCMIDGQLRGMAELIPEREHVATAAELAITVEQPFQDQGIGTELLRKMLTIARNRAIGKVYMICLIDNRRMQHVAEKLAANLVVDVDEVEGFIRPVGATYFTLAEEVLMDGQALWRAVLEVNALVNVDR